MTPPTVDVNDSRRVGRRPDFYSHSKHTAIARDDRSPAEAQVIQRDALVSCALGSVVESEEGAVHT